MSSALLQELEEGVQALGESRMRYYKIMSLFSFENGNEIHFGDGLAGFCNDRQQYDQLKDFIKEQKKWVKTTPESIHNLHTRLWWLQIKLVEFGVFTPSEQRSLFPLMVLHSPQPL
jgi:hypothetical protein